MLAFMTLSLMALTLLWLVPTLVFLLEVVAGCSASREPQTSFAQSQGRIAVLIPAHNESTGLQPTLDDIKPQLGSTNRLVVVADNCSDDTASVATERGAEVAIRNDLTRIGKGYA